MKSEGTDQQDEWISAQDFAREIRVPVRTVLSWRQRGQGPTSAKFGKHVRYRRSDVRAWIRQQMSAQ